MSCADGRPAELVAGGNASPISPELDHLRQSASKVPLDGTTVEERKHTVPGARASTVDVDRLWNSMTRWLLASPSVQLRCFVHSFFSQQVGRTYSFCTPRPVWPIPLPYRGSDAAASDRENSFRRAINLVVIVLNWLHLELPRHVPQGFNPRQQLTGEQKLIVSRLRKLMREWYESGPVTASDMGRSASKVEHLETSLSTLTTAALALVASGGSGNKATVVDNSAKGTRSPTLLRDISVAKDIQSDRLQFRGVPTFDPSSLLDDDTEKMYTKPFDCALDPMAAAVDPPHVQVRGNRSEILDLFKKLDATGRLALFEPHEVRMQHRAGWFCLAKDLTRDRLILDSRPANQLEAGITTWTSSMASITPLLDVFIPPGHTARCAGEDLRDYYYFFQVSRQRACRNAIRYELSLGEVKDFNSYARVRPGQRIYIPALQTLAMGDINAVEFGQQAHVKLAIASGICVADLLTLRGRLRRASPYIGIVIDDFVAIDVLPEPAPADCPSTAVADKMVSTYAEVGLQSHEGKRFRNEEQAKFWGASMDGSAGTIRSQLEKVIPLAFITSQVARLGWATRKLLEILSGAWVSIMQCRRRCMCLLGVLFDEIQQYDYTATFPLRAAAVDELWTLVTLGPLFVTDLRADVCTEFSLVDASNDFEAEVSADVSRPLAFELIRQRLTKAAWSRLLSPLAAVKKLHGQLEPWEEVATGEEAANDHPLWTGVVKSRRFRQQWRKKVRGRPHINVSEMAAALRSERRRCRRFPNKRLMTGSDSQVVLGALVKGRSSSKILNLQLKVQLPWILAYNSYNAVQYIGTADNVADDPTRDKVCRPPSSATPRWISAIDEDDYRGLDEVLEERGIDDLSIARLDLPSALQQKAELSPSVPLQPMSKTRPIRTGRDGGRRKPPVAAVVNPEPWLPRRLLSDSARSLLHQLPTDQFVFPFGVSREDCLAKPGHLDLFSGCRIAAKELARKTGRWVLTYDILHSPQENLLDELVQAHILKMLRAGCFLSLTAGPVCSSFSRAVRPPVRSASLPAGLPTMTANMKVKVEIGNAMSLWLAGLVQEAIAANLPFWIENPAGSFLWLQREWLNLIEEHGIGSFYTDYCRWGTPWRKRTRFLGSFTAAGLKFYCNCLVPHVRLDGYSAKHKCCWTKAAESYPKNLARYLAAALTESLKPTTRRRIIDPGVCAKCGRGRVGEAANPGPRTPAPRP